MGANADTNVATKWSRRESKAGSANNPGSLIAGSLIACKQTGYVVEPASSVDTVARRTVMNRAPTACRFADSANRYAWRCETRQASPSCSYGKALASDLRRNSWDC